MGNIHGLGISGIMPSGQAPENPSSFGPVFNAIVQELQSQTPQALANSLMPQFFKGTLQFLSIFMAQAPTSSNMQSTFNSFNQGIESMYTNSLKTPPVPLSTAAFQTLTKQGLQLSQDADNIQLTVSQFKSILTSIMAQVQDEVNATDFPTSVNQVNILLGVISGVENLPYFEGAAEPLGYRPINNPNLDNLDNSLVQIQELMSSTDTQQFIPGQVEQAKHFLSSLMADINSIPTGNLHEKF